MRVPDAIRDCVAYLGLLVTDASGEQKVSLGGTGFFVMLESGDIPGLSYIFLVTAAHVAEKLEGKDFAIRMNTKAGTADFARSGANVRWWYHPDRQVDVALVPWAPPLEHFEYKVLPLLDMVVTDEVVRSEHVGLGDEVFLTGLFANLVGNKKNIPIVRIGNIAMMPDEPVPTERGSMMAYLIESRSLGGLSGSPAFVNPVRGDRFFLLGVVHGHWKIPTDPNNVVNMGIALVTPAERILEVIHQPELLDMRKRHEENLKEGTLPSPDAATSFRGMF